MLLVGTATVHAETLALLPPLVGTAEAFSSSSRAGLAIAGYDPVSYFLAGRPVAGRPEHEILWSGSAWRFDSAANLTAFRRDPAAFAPRIGGFDATAAAEGRLVDAAAEIYAVRDGRLFLFRNPASRARFLAEPHAAERAEAQWASLRARLVQD
jgi:hypothetical protein